MDGIEVLFFGQLTDVTATQRIRVAEVEDTAQLERILHARFPGLAGKKYRIVVNQQLVAGNLPLDPGMQVALLPPFSGG